MFSNFLAYKMVVWFICTLFIISCGKSVRPWRILVVAAEKNEINCAQKAYENLFKGQKSRLKVDFLVTGIGINHSVYALTKKILAAKVQDKAYDMIIDIGIGGSYDIESYPLGAVVFVGKEYFADLGFQFGNNFQDLFQSNLWQADLSPFSSGGIVRLQSQFSELETWLRVRGLVNGATVQMVSGSLGRAQKIRQQYQVAVESMEGASIYYVAQMEQIPCLEIRSISNAVAETNHRKWDIPLALAKLEKSLGSIFTQICR